MIKNIMIFLFPSPYMKALLYNGDSLQPHLSPQEETSLKEIVADLWKESQGAPIYEGRFGASPREIKSILYRACHHEKSASLTPFSIFNELETLVKDRTLYEFLQYQPKAGYHDVGSFTKVLKNTLLESLKKSLFIQCHLLMMMIMKNFYKGISIML